MKNIRDTAILVGYDESGKCVYSDSVDISTYYDGDHPWDDASKVKKLKLRKVHGYLFDDDGELSQEFESLFSTKTGIYEGGFARFADGTERRD